MATNDTRVATSSVEEFAGESLRLSKEFVHHLWARVFDWCLNRVAKDFMWIGSHQEMYTVSQEGFSGVLSKLGATIVRSTVTDEEYTVIVCDEHVCGVAGRFLVLTPAADHIAAQWCRCTFIWRRSGRKYQLAHLHMSAPLDYVERGESYPIHAGTETYRYMKSLMRLGSSRKNVSLYDADGTVHWVHPSQIIYLEANRKRTTVHCMTKSIVVPAVIRDAIDMVGPKIMRVHRSYAVNRDHVIELKAGRLLLDDGTSIAIPAKRLADVRAQLTGN